MIIEDPENFRTWLTAKLGPLCDADPEALAKYVYALVKKDKPVEELRASMIGQLEVFLQRETQDFVNHLFRTLETQCFDLSAEPTLGAVAQVQTPAAAAPTPSVDIDLRDPQAFPVPMNVEETDKKNAKEPPNPVILVGTQNTNSFGSMLLAAANRREPERHARKSESDKEDRNRRVRRRGSSPSPERRRSRSRSFERRRSRSRERERGRAWRNKSPPRRYERRRSYSKTPPRRYSKSRSPQSKRIRYRNRSPPHSRSRSPLAATTLDNRERKDVVAPSLPIRDNTHGDTDLRNMQSVVAVPPEVPPYPPTRRCRDFDVRGFCIRGDLCPFDHGADPVILEEVGLPMYNGVPSQPPPIEAPLHHLVPPPNMIRHPAHPPLRPPPVNLGIAEYNPDAPSMEPRMWGRPHQFRGNPMMRGMARGGNNMGRGGFPQNQRILINVVTGSQNFRHQRPNMPNAPPEFNGRVNANNDVNKPPFDFNRLGANKIPIPQNKGGNTSLHLKKVPPGANNITHLNNHFSKFGKIVNIQVCFEGDPKSALITFSTHTEANIAYKSTEAVLNNRFIRVFWYNPNNNTNNENNDEDSPPAARPSVLERLGAPPTKVLNNIQPSSVQPEEKVTLTNNNLSKTLYIPSAVKKDLPSTPSIEQKEPVKNKEELKKKMEEVTIAKKKQVEAIKAGFKLNADLRKRKTELLEKTIGQQKVLIQRMEDPGTTPQQKANLMETIKSLQENIENIRKDLSTSVKANLSKVSKANAVKNHITLIKKTREETQRELLDAELDLINRQHEGKDTDELKKKVADLKLRAYSLGLSSARGVTRGRGTAVRVRGRGRGLKFLSNVSYDHNVVDHRPKKVLVSGYEQDDKADVLTHFGRFGPIEDYDSDDATPSLVLNFKSRKDAEVAIVKGRNFHDRLLSVTWATPNMNIRSGITSKPETPIHRSVMVMEEEDDVGEEVLEEEADDDEFVGLSPVFFNQENDELGDEEEEDEEDEDRSWRR